MTVASTTNRKTFAGNGVTTSFGTSPVVFFDTSDMTVQVVDDTTGVATALTENTHYTVIGGAGTTGTIDLSLGSSPYGAPASGTTLVLLRVLPLTQEVDLVNNDPSDAEVMEDALDRDIMIAQQLSEVNDRTLKLPEGETGSAALTELPSDRAGMFLGFDSLKNIVALAGTVGVAVSAFMEPVLAAANAAAARLLLGAAAVGANTDITSLGGISNAALGDVLIAQTSGVYRRAGLPTGWQNGTVTAANAANAMTISLLDANGATPSAANPVFISFRNVSASSGSPTTLLVTSATQLVISSGSTLGTISAQANRIWIVAFNDAGTVRLGAINCLVQPGSGVTQVFPLKNGIASSTAEGGAGAADSAGVFYTGTAVTSKAYTVLGYIESTQATAGTWATPISKAQAYGPATPLPGDVVQDISKVYSAAATGTTAMARDDTVPLIGEGDQYMSQAVTAIDACNAQRVSVVANLSNSNANVHLLMSVFADSTLVGAVAEYVGVTTGSVSKQLSVQQDYIPNTASAVTYTVRAGGTTGATTTFNGASGSRLLGGAMSSTITIQEIMS